MCIFHDMGEAFTGDIPVFNKTEDHEKIESEKLYSWIDSLPCPYNKNLQIYLWKWTSKKLLKLKFIKL